VRVCELGPDEDAHQCRDAHSLACCACCTPDRAEGAGANSERELDCANALDVQCAPLATDPTAACFKGQTPAAAGGFARF
jgi:hypothetical protein